MNARNRVRICDTTRSKWIGTVKFDGGDAKERWWEESLYRTRDGRWYLAGSGGSRSKYGRRAKGEAGSSAATVIIPLLLCEAAAWAKKMIRKMLRVDASTGRPSQLNAKMRAKLQRLVGQARRSPRRGVPQRASAGGVRHGG